MYIHVQSYICCNLIHVKFMEIWNNVVQLLRPTVHMYHLTLDKIKDVHA